MNPGNSEDRPRCIRILEIVILVDAFKDTEKNVAILMIEHKLFHQSGKVIISTLVLRRISLAVGDFKGMGFIGVGSCSKEFVLFGKTFLFLWIVLQDPPFVVDQIGGCIAIPLPIFDVVTQKSFSIEQTYQFYFAELFEPFKVHWASYQGLLFDMELKYAGDYLQRFLVNPLLNFRVQRRHLFVNSF